MKNDSDDYNKSKRTTMWWSFGLLLLTIPVFLYFDNKQYTRQDFVTIENLVLSQDSYKDPGGGKSAPPSVKLKFSNTPRGFNINYEEYQCISINDILANFKKGDTVSIGILESDKDVFYSTTFLSKYTKLFALSRHGKEYINLDCRNRVSIKRANAGVIASGISAILSLFFAVVVLKPMTKHQAVGYLPFDPVFIVLLAWLIVCLALR